jgi:hypothetical protein
MLKQTVQANVPNWNGKLLTHVMPWFNEPGKIHRVSRYASNDPAVVEAQLDAMQAVGIEGIIVTYQGPSVSPFSHDSTMRLWEGCLEHQMLFALCLDPWIAKASPNPTQAAIIALQSPDVQRMINSPAYLPERFIIEFDLANSAGVTIATLQAATPTTPLLTWHVGYSWPNAPADPHNPVDALATLKSDNAKPTMKMPGINIRFNDGGAPLPAGVPLASFKGLRDYNNSVWGAGTGAARVIDHQAGNWFFDQLAVTPPAAPYVCLVTWNDSDEGTDNEATIAALSGHRIGH